MLPPVETPKANPENLLTLIRDAHDGKVVIPEFQRSFVWSREDIEELLVSILQGYFIGTFLMLDTPPDKSMFPFRPVEGLDHVNPGVAPHKLSTVRLALDGQQRISSLFYVLYEPPIPLKYARNPYRFFFRLDLALDANPVDAVYGISLNDRVRLSEMQKLVGMDSAIPFSLFLESSQFYYWLYNKQKFLTTEKDKKMIEGFYQRFEKFMVPVVGLTPDAGKDNIVNIFERINRMGVKLALFDLAVARLYVKDVRLRDLWKAFKTAHPKVAEIIKPEFILKVIALRQGKEPRSSTLLDVIDEFGKKEFEEQWALACEYAAKAHNRMREPSGGYGAYAPGWTPYTTMIVPLAVLLRVVEEHQGGESLYRLLDKWYWTTVFAQRYDSAVDTKSYSDVKEATGWLEGKATPSWFQSVSVDKLSLDTEEKRSAVYRGLMCSVVMRGARDFLTGQAVNLGECQDDHIFPKSIYGNYAGVNSILNRTLITPESNRSKWKKKPSEFLPIFLAKHGGDEGKLRKTLATHFINDQAVAAMKQDDMDGFLKAREGEFASHINSILSQ